MSKWRAKPNGEAIKELKKVDKEIASNGEAFMNVDKEEAFAASNGEHFIVIPLVMLSRILVRLQMGRLS